MCASCVFFKKCLSSKLHSRALHGDWAVCLRRRLSTSHLLLPNKSRPYVKNRQVSCVYCTLRWLQWRGIIKEGRGESNRDERKSLQGFNSTHVITVVTLSFPPEIVCLVVLQEKMRSIFHPNNHIQYLFHIEHILKLYFFPWLPLFQTKYTVSLSLECTLFPALSPSRQCAHKTVSLYL